MKIFEIKFKMLVPDTWTTEKAIKITEEAFYSPGTEYTHAALQEMGGSVISVGSTIDNQEIVTYSINKSSQVIN